MSPIMKVRPTFRSFAVGFSVSFLTLPAAVVAQEALRHRGQLIERIDSLVQVEMERAMTAGVSVAVEHRGDVVIARGYGYADLEHDVPATAETIFRLGSVTKQFTALAILQLVEQEKIGLDDDITEYLPDYPTQGNAVSVHHLLTHTSGIKSYTGLGPKFWDASRLDLSHNELVALFAAEPFDFAPGDEWLYNNSGYYLLGMIIERITEQAYADYVAEHIFGPLGMTGSSYCSDRAIVRQRARGYSPEPGYLVNADPLSMRLPGAAGALCSNVLDLLRWQRALDGNRLLPQTLRDRMITEATLNDGSGTGYAYGYRVGDVEGHRVIQHGGVINGFVTALANFPDDELTVAVLANTDQARSGPIAMNIARLVLGLPLQSTEAVTDAAPPEDQNDEPASEIEMQDVELPAGWRGRYPGTYTVGDAEMRVYAEGDGLRVDVPDQVNTRLVHQGEGIFAVQANPGLVVEFEVSGGRAIAVIVVNGDQRMRGERLAQPDDEPPEPESEAVEEPEPKSLDLPAGWRERYPGSYTMTDLQVRVYAEGDSLMLTTPGQVTTRLLYQGDDAFVMAVGKHVPVEFEISGSRATAVVFVTPNGRMRGERGNEMSGVAR